jgi:hypothetical protein
MCVMLWKPISVAARSKTWACGSLVAGIAGSNHAEGMDIRHLCLYVVLSSVGRGLCDGWSLVQRSPTVYLNKITKLPQWGGQSSYNDCRATDDEWFANHGKAVPLHAMEALGGRGGIAPTHSRPRHLMGVSGQHHAPAALYPRGKDHRYPLYRRLGGPQSRSGHRG